MSWHEFLDLISGLSPDSRFMLSMRRRAEARSKRRTFTSQAELDAAMDAAYGG